MPSSSTILFKNPVLNFGQVHISKGNLKSPGTTGADPASVVAGFPSISDEI